MKKSCKTCKWFKNSTEPTERIYDLGQCTCPRPPWLDPDDGYIENDYGELCECWSWSSLCDEKTQTS
jgi:hypothetical protein